MQNTKTDKKKFSEDDLLKFVSIVDVCNCYGVPWFLEIMQALKAPTKATRDRHLKKLEQQIALETTRIDNTHAKARRILAHIRVNPSPEMNEEIEAALLVAAEVSAGTFRTLGFEPEPEFLTTANGDEESKAIGFYVYDKQTKKSRRKPRPRPRPEPEDDE